MENYLSYKDRMEEVNQFRENKLEITPYAEYKYGISPKSPLKDFILDIILIPFVVFAFSSPVHVVFVSTAKTGDLLANYLW